jgi:serine/threonine protein kinase
MSLGNRYRAIRLLGSGGYGSVYEAEDIDTNQRVAVKQSNLPDVEDDPTDQVFLLAIGHPFIVFGHHDLTSRHAFSHQGIQTVTLREAMVVRLRHPNLVRLIRVYDFERKHNFVFEVSASDRQQRCSRLCKLKSLAKTQCWYTTT